MTLLAEHITSGGLKELAYQQEPDSILWACLDNGKLIGLTYRRQENVVAWHNHVLGGTSSNGSYGSVESIACIPGDQDEDDLYMVVERTISGLAAAADDDAISLLFTCGSTQTTFPIDGASASSGTATFSNARQVTFFNDNNAAPGSAISSALNLVLTIVGTDADGASQTETIDLDQNAATYTSTNFSKQSHL